MLLYNYVVGSLSVYSEYAEKVKEKKKWQHNDFHKFMKSEGQGDSSEW